MKDIGDEMEFKKDGIIQNRAKNVLDNALSLLQNIDKEGLFNALEKGIFAEIKRFRDGGKGLEGVIQKAPNYINPFEKLMKE